ncbi:hypothetical protein, partial [Stenotrophomonas maltophilia]|uniref:hypothetical protein n=1 Tax=Stenotrophomonas maltophilia TaxID=40324 RepID=UPI003B9E90B1
MSRALGRDALAGECPPASACGRHLLLYFAHKGIATHVSRPLAPKERHGVAHAFRTPSPVAAGRPLGKIKEEAVAARR